MDAEQQAALRQIEDEATAKHRDGKGRVDHVAAAAHRRDELAALEAGGHQWAGTVRDAAEIDGHRRAIARRWPSISAAIPMPDGKVSMPATYARKNDDGGQQLALWLHLPVDELERLVADMLRRSNVLNERAVAMRFGLELARKHGKDTAAEGFTAEGISIGEAAV